MTVLLIAVFGLGVKAQVPAPVDPSSEAWDWVHQVEEEVWRRIAPVPRPEALASYDRHHQWVGVITATDGYSNSWQLVIRKSWKLGATVEYLYLRENLGFQLAVLRTQRPDLTIEAAIAALVRQRSTSDTFQCPGIRDLIREFASVEVPVVPDRVLILHPRSYTVFVASAHRTPREWVVYSGEGALAELCGSLLEAAVACRASASPDAPQGPGAPG